MKRIRSTIVKVAFACSIVAAFWFVGNYMHVLPEQESAAAACSVADKYMQPKVGEEFLAIESGEQPMSNYPYGEVHTFEIHDGELIVAKVQLNNFLGLGWQFHSFSRFDL